MFAPLEGWRRVKVTDRHAAVDYAQILKELSDTHVTGAKPRESVILGLPPTRASTIRWWHAITYRSVRSATRRA
jgi:hypothetical protein